MAATFFGCEALLCLMLFVWSDCAFRIYLDRRGFEINGFSIQFNKNIRGLAL